MSYRGGTIPKRQTKQMRKLLSDLNEIATRGSDTPRKASTGAGTNTQPGNIQPVLPNVIYNEDSSAGIISSIPVAPAGTLRITRYSGNPKFAAGGNLDLAGPSFQADPNGLVAWMSNGNRWRELSRGPGAETFVPVRRYGALPGIASDQTSKVQAAFDNAPAGSVLVFEPGTYVITQVNLTRTMSICIPPGCTIQSTGSTKAAIYIAGTVNTSSATSLVTNPTDVLAPPGPDDPVYPRGGDWIIYVTPGDEAGFPAGTWIRIEDDEAPSVGFPSPPDTELQFWYHSELVKVESTASGIIRLQSPLINTYVRVGASDPRIRVVTPVEGVRVWGGGTITNPQAASGQAHGIKTFYAVDVRIEGMRFNQCWDSGVHASHTRQLIITGCEFQNALRFDDRGYGFNCHTGQRITLSHNTFKRLRHCIDFGTFSRMVEAIGNQCVGSTTGNIITHPSVEGVNITGNLIDGGLGQDTKGTSAGDPPSLEYGDSTVQASGINIDNGVKNATVVGNTIRNMRLSGIYVDTGGPGFATEFVTISGNTIENCCLYRRVSPGSITQHAGIAIQENSAGGTDRRGFVVTNNTLREPGPYGILAGISNMIISNNWIYKAEDKMLSGTPPVVGIGIWIKPSASGVPRNISVKNNICTSCKQNGIRAGVNAGTAIAVPVIESNYCSDNGGDGIFLEEICTAPMINYNICWNNGGDGINNQSPGGFIVGNRLSSNTGVGIRLIAGADNNLVKDNIFEGAGTKINDLAASTFYMYIDDTNDRYGIGTATPQKRLEVVGAERLSFSTAANDFTDLTQLDRTGFYGGLAIEPAANSSALKWIHLFGQSEGTGLSILDDGTDFWFGRTSVAKDIQFEIAAGRAYRFNSNFDLLLQLMGPRGVTGAANIFVPSVYKLDDTSTNTILQPITVQRNVSGGNGANGIGARISWAAENTAGTLITMSDWEAVFDIATSTTEDSSVRFTIKDGGLSKEIVRFEGATPQILFHNAAGTPSTGAEMVFNVNTGMTTLNLQSRSGGDLQVKGQTDANLFFCDASADKVGIGTNAPAQKLDVRGAVDINSGATAVDGLRVAVSGAGNANMILVQDQAGSAGRVGIRQSAPAETLHVTGNFRVDTSARVGGDTGSGVTGFTTLTNGAPVVGGGASTATFAANGINGTGLPANIAQAGWLKVYVGTTTAFVPYWT